MMQDSDAHQLERLLDRVHRAILVGDIALLGPLDDQIAQLLPQMQILHDRPLANRLRDKAARNAACLQASARGIRSAQRRIVEIRTARDGVVTYDGQGKRHEVSQSLGHLTRRL